MRSDWTRKNPNPITGVHTRRDHLHKDTERSRPCDNRDQSDASTSQTPPSVVGGHQERGERQDSPSETPEGTNPAHLDSGLPVSRIVAAYIPVVLSQSVHGNLL